MLRKAAALLAALAEEVAAGFALPGLLEAALPAALAQKVDAAGSALPAGLAVEAALLAAPLAEAAVPLAAAALVFVEAAAGCRKGWAA